MVQTDLSVNNDALEEWVEYRKENKKPLSPLALKKVIKKLSAHDLEHQQHMVDEAIENDWTGLHEVERKKQITLKPDNQVGFVAKHTDKSWREGL